MAHGIGDALTFWVLDDQAKQILARSVVRPDRHNLRVKWDPDLGDNSKVTATSAGEGNIGLIAVDKDNEGNEVIVIEEDPSSPSADDNVNPGMDTSKLQVPTTGVITRSKGKLKLDNCPVGIDESIQTFTRSKKQAYKDIVYQGSPDSGEVNTLIMEPMKDRPRRSERLKTTWGPSKVTRALIGSTNELLVLPSAIQALPVIKLKDDPWEHKTSYSTLINDQENLRAYHAKLDLMEFMDQPDQSNKKWQVESINE